MFIEYTAYGVHPNDYAHISWLVLFCCGLTQFNFIHFLSHTSGIGWGYRKDLAPGLLDWHWSSHTMDPVPVKQPQRIWLNKPLLTIWFICGNIITTTHSTIKPCAYFMACITLCMHPANERWRYNVTSSPIGWADTQIGPCIYSD